MNKRRKQSGAPAPGGGPGSAGRPEPAPTGLVRVTAAELPPEITEYLALVDADSPRACPEQHALAAHIRKSFDTEPLYIDKIRTGKYFSLQKYFPFQLFPWEKFLIALWLCTYRAVSWEEGTPSCEPAAKLADLPTDGDGWAEAQAPDGDEKAGRLPALQRNGLPVLGAGTLEEELKLHRIEEDLRAAEAVAGEKDSSGQRADVGILRDSKEFGPYEDQRADVGIDHYGEQKDGGDTSTALRRSPSPASRGGLDGEAAFVPRWKTCFGMIARGSGKDGFIGFAGLCLTSPFNPCRRYDVDICANDEVQAKRPLEDLVNVLETPGQEAKLDRHFYHTKEMIQGRKNRGKIRGWTNNAKNRDGLRSGLIVFNEVHQFQDYRNINVFTSGLGKVPEPRIGIFSSNGKVSDGPLDDYLAQSRRILFEGEDDQGFLPFVCCLESREQVRDRDCWPMANPSWAYLPHLRQETADEFQDFQEHPERHGDFLSKRMGLRAGFSELAVTDYAKILATNKPLPELKGWSCAAGLDYAELSDWASLVLLFRRGEERLAICHTWICEESKTLHRVKAPWEAWVELGYCTLVREPTIPPKLLAEWLQQAGTQYRIRKLAMDGYRWTLVSDAMIGAGWDARDKNRVKLVRPSDIMKVEPVVQRCFDAELFSWGDCPPLRWATNNAKRIPASRGIGSDTGNFYFGKIEAKSRKTDPFMALVAAMCVEDAIPRSGPARLPPAPFIIR